MSGGVTIRPKHAGAKPEHLTKEQFEQVKQTVGERTLAANYLVTEQPTGPPPALATVEDDKKKGQSDPS